MHLVVIIFKDNGKDKSKMEGKKYKLVIMSCNFCGRRKKQWCLKRKERHQKWMNKEKKE
jgi:hypothetical protein